MEKEGLDKKQEKEIKTSPVFTMRKSTEHDINYLFGVKSSNYQETIAGFKLT